MPSQQNNPLPIYQKLQWAEMITFGYDLVIFGFQVNWGKKSVLFS